MKNDDNVIGYVDDHGYVSYRLLRQAMQGKPYEFEAMGSDAHAVMAAVNQGIDSHLEACYCPSLGDSYVEHNRRLDPCDRFPNGRVYGAGIKATVSPESLPILLRRLMELPERVEEHGEKPGLTAAIAEEGESFALTIADDLLSRRRVVKVAGRSRVAAT